MQRIKNIEFLRIVGCIAIVMLHFGNSYFGKYYGDIPFYHQLAQITSNGQKGVELFFILSGCFFAITLNINISVWEFIKRKIIRLYPVLIFVMLGIGVLSIFKLAKVNLYGFIFCLVGLNSTYLSIPGMSTIGVYWYVAIMLWCLLLYFYLSKYYEQKNIKLFAFIAVFICYGTLIHLKGGKINAEQPSYLYIWDNVVTLRGLGGISLGYLIGDWYKNNIEAIKNYIPSFKQKLVLTFLEIACLFFTINNLLFHQLKFKNDVIYIIVFTVITILFLLNKGYISKILDNDICGKLSRYAYSIYMTHTTIIRPLLKHTLWNNQNFVTHHPIMNLAVTLLITFSFGILTYHLVEAPCTKWLKTNIAYKNPISDSEIYSE